MSHGVDSGDRSKAGALPTADGHVFWFDVVRGLAALAVCAGHLRAMVFVDRGEIVSSAWWHAPFYLVTGFGHQAVMVFFVLSGYLVGGSIVRNRHTFSWPGYAVARLTRLWTVLLPALLFTAAADAVLRGVDGRALQGAYQQLWMSGPTGDYDASISAFVANALFLQTIVSPVFGSNGPLWSLANEFWYYALFPLLLAIPFPRFRPASIGVAVLSAGLIWYLPSGLVASGAIWLLGVLMFLVSGVRVAPAIRAFTFTLSGVLLLLALSATKSVSMLGGLASWGDYAVGSTFAVFAWHLIGLPALASRRIKTMAALLSDTSFTIYLFHFPLIVMLGAVVLRGRQFQPSGFSLAWYLATLSAVLGFCYVAWFLFERRTASVRRFMTERIRVTSRHARALTSAPGPSLSA